MTHASSTPRRRRGFTLAEVLLAVAILAIGIISIAALFPAGIALQRRSTDDVMGPIIANNAMSLIRTKVKPGDFTPGSQLGHLSGDFGWSRPAFYSADDTDTDLINERGAINLFRDLSADGLGSESELTNLDNSSEPIIILQNERYYPTVPQDLFNDAAGYTQPATWANREVPVPQYVWECMFRRFQGRMFVSIFVYRVNVVGGGPEPYVVRTNGDVPPMPVFLDLTDGSLPHPWAGNAWDAINMSGGSSAIIPNTGSGTAYNPQGTVESWQAPSQWLLDQNNNVRRVLAGRRNATDGPVQLVRPIYEQPDLPIFAYQSVANNNGFIAVDSDNDGLLDQNIVTSVWYIPTEVEVDVNGNGSTTPFQLTPIYVAVREL